MDIDPCAGQDGAIRGNSTDAITSRRINPETINTKLGKVSKLNVELKEPAEILSFIVEDLQRYKDLPKCGCIRYVTRSASEDAFNLIKEQHRTITEGEVHCIVHDHLTRAVKSERWRKYTPD